MQLVGVDPAERDRVADEFVERLVAASRSVKAGDNLGPMTTRAQYEKVLEYFDIAGTEGVTAETGGQALPEDERGQGYFVPATIYTGVDNSMRIAREEVFGPFVTVASFDGDEEAVAMANSTSYGLGGGLWTRDLRRAHRVADAIRSGMVWVNSYKRVHPGSPFGGVGESGYGREMGFEVMHGYTDPKSVWVNVDATLPPFYQRDQ